MKEGGQGDPLPRGPVLALAGVFLTNALSSTVLLPFAAFMVASFHVTEDQNKLGYYAGYLASAFNVGTLCSCFFWGTFSDRVGRRPVLLFGLLNNLVCALLFGFSSSLPMAMGARFLNGLLSGIIGVGKTALAEITNESNQASGFAVIGVCRGIGLLFGPALGGFLCQPVEKYPAFFSPGSLFDIFPFALPCLVLAVLTAVGLAATYLLLPETLCPKTPEISFVALSSDSKPLLSDEESDPPSKDTELLPPGKRVSIYIERGGSEDGKWSTTPTAVRSRKGCFAESAQAEEGSEDDRGVATWNWLPGWLLKRKTYTALPPEGAGQARGVLRNVLGERDTAVCVAIYCLVSFIFSAFDEVFPLWGLMDWGSGGLSWGTNNLGLAQTVGGASLIPFQLLLYPRIVSRVGPLNTLRLGLCFGPALAMFPLLHFVGRGGGVQMVAAGGAMVLRSISSLCCFTSIFILVSNSVSDPSFLGATNGLAQTGAAMSRAIAPTVGGSLFAWSVSRHGVFPFDYHLPFLLIGSCMLLSGAVTTLLPKTINERKFTSGQ